MKRLLTTTAIVAGAFLFASAAQANIIFLEGNHPQADEVNVLFGSSEVGVTLANGEVGHTGATVRFTTLGDPLQILKQQAKGQADILCAANCIDNGPVRHEQLGSIRMSAGLLDGQLTGWKDVILNLDFGIGDANVHVVDNFGGDFVYSLKNGQNFLTILAVDDQVITRVDITNANPDQPFGFNSFKQPRVSGLCVLDGESGCEPVIITTPEPVSLALLGVGVLGLAAVRRRS